MPPGFGDNDRMEVASFDIELFNLQLREVRPAGFEPATHGLEIRCSIQLSYGRKLLTLNHLHSVNFC